MGTCDKDCHCEIQDECNSYTGECEHGDCQPGWGSYYCTLQLSKDSEAGVSEAEVEPIVILCVIVGVVIVALAVMVVSVRKSKKQLRQLMRVQSSEIEMSVQEQEATYL